MLTRFVRIQLIIFTVASIVGVALMVFQYMRVPTLLGIGRITVTLQLPAAGGLYRFSNVTYRGTQIGTVTDIQPTAAGATATLSLATEPAVPADLQAEVRSVSAVGEQFVELRPHTDAPPYLHTGSIIPADRVTIPQRVGPMLDQLSSLLASIPQHSLTRLVEESAAAFGDAGDDLGSLIDSSARLSTHLAPAAPAARTLTEGAEPLVDSQAESADAIRSWAHSLAGLTSQLHTNDPQIRTFLHGAPPAAAEVTKLLEQVKPTLPILLANLTSVGQVAVTYHPSLEQLLVLLPPLTANFIASSPFNNYTGLPVGDFRLTAGDPSPCTVGFLPPNMWRPPTDTSETDTPDGLYCKLPQDSPVAVRGARNYPCMDVPGKRAPTVAQCHSDKPFIPTAVRGHATGPYPFDPNLISQGVPPDYRVTAPDRLYGPTDGTAQPPDQNSVPSQPPPTRDPPAPAAEQPTADAPDTDDPPPQLSPSALHASTPIATAIYDPLSGKYSTNGHVYSQHDLARNGSLHTWEQLVLPA